MVLSEIEIKEKVTMFGQNLRKVLKDRKITSKQLAGAVGISEAYVSYLLAGKKKPSMELMENIGEYLGVKPSALLETKEPPIPEGLEALAKKYESVLLALESMSPELVADLTVRIEAAASLFPHKDAPKRTGQGGASYSRGKKPG